MKNPLIGNVRFYQRFISPGLPTRCRYYSACSQYMINTIHTHGSVKETAMGVARILWCHSFVKDGINYVPLKFRLAKNPDEAYHGPYTYRRDKKMETEKGG